MSSELDQLTVRIQEALGFTGADLDGRYGVKTAHAVIARLTAASSSAEQPAPAPVSTVLAIDARSQRNILTLAAWVRPAATDFLAHLHASGINAQIISGTRTYAEQDALYAKGRTTDGPVVTNARSGYSNHNF